MADSVFAITVKNVGNNVGVGIIKTPASLPVAGATSKVLFIESLKDQGFGGPGTDLAGTADGRHPVANVTAASNATPIVVTMDQTAAALGIVAQDQVAIEDVLGNTGANGTFFVTSVAGSTVTLESSAGVAAYTSGGKIWKINKARGYHSALRRALTGVLDEKSLNG